MAAVIERERLLLRPEVRADPEKTALLLHRDFQEFGASGRAWDRDTVIDALAADPAMPGTAETFAPVRLADGVVLLTNRLSGQPRSLRSSLWVRDRTAGWQLRFHQGTPMPR
ncbi:nuclear transport factor 2 family protein [Georgenia yuyongxinii]|uniref:Nuclear transport factor 2 family protein n=2 Tax=Georgenia yuyongxinii TaxID=2589797 RepID=A0A552WUK2_9MICO|nr:nuclear transport factor 2 family protein [Georgenia yuyongxinii]